MQMCKAIDEGKDTFGKLYGAANVYYNSSGKATCFDLNGDSDPHGLGGWNWQACTEMVMPTGGSNNESMFPPAKWDYNGRLQFCKYFYHIQPRPHWITTHFGGHVSIFCLYIFTTVVHRIDGWFSCRTLRQFLRDLEAIYSFSMG